MSRTRPGRRRTGRRPGKHDTRAEILAAAREAFGTHGYDGTSVRRIATSAGVDPALVHHYFGTKDGLFLATVEAPIDPAIVLPRVIEGPLDELGSRVVSTFLGVWADPVTGPAIRATVRSAVTNDLSARLVREFFATQIARRIMRALDAVPAEEIPMRASLVASQLFGLALARHILRLEPLASMPAETVVAVAAPTIQRYLTADLSAPLSQLRDRGGSTPV